MEQGTLTEKEENWKNLCRRKREESLADGDGWQRELTGRELRKHDSGEHSCKYKRPKKKPGRARRKPGRGGSLAEEEAWQRRKPSRGGSLVEERRKPDRGGRRKKKPEKGNRFAKKGNFG